MKITENAKKYILSEISNENDGIIIKISNSCCSVGEDIRLAFGHTNGDYMIINGIKVYYDSYHKDYINDLIIDYKNNMIIFEGEEK